MSAPRAENATDKLVKQYLRARLKIAEQQGYSFKYTDDFVDYLKDEGGLDKICNEWIRDAPNEVLRELLRDHEGQHGQFQTGAPLAGSLNVGGPPVPHISNRSDSGYDPGSPMADLRMHSLSQDSSFDVFFVPAAVPDAPPLNLRARIDAERDNNIIDVDCAKSLCGDQASEGQRVLVSYRSTHDDPDGRNTKQIHCLVGRLKNENVIFYRAPPELARSDFHSESSLGKSLSRRSSLDQAEFNQDEFQEKRAEIAARMANAMAIRDMRNRKRPAEDDDGRYQPARRTRTRES